MKILLVLSLILASLGCGAKQEDPPPPAANDGKKPAPKGLARTIRRPQAQTELREIARFYTLYLDANRSRPPAGVKVFQDYIKREAGQLAQALEDGSYEMNLKARPDANQILAWEAEPDERGNVMVVRMDNSVHSLTVDELRVELQERN